MFRNNRQARMWASLLVALFVVGGVAAAVFAGRAEASARPPAYPVPCRSCTYWVAASVTLTDSRLGVPTTFTIGAEHVVYRNGQDHIRNVAWYAENQYGPTAPDRVRLVPRIARGGPAIMDALIWDPAGRWGQEYVGRDNGRTVQGINVVGTAWFNDRPVSVTVRPEQMVRGAEVQALRAAVR
jgi:hypothetical protein